MSTPAPKMKDRIEIPVPANGAYEIRVEVVYLKGFCTARLITNDEQILHLLARLAIDQAKSVVEDIIVFGDEHPGDTFPLVSAELGNLTAIYARVDLARVRILLSKAESEAK